MEIPLLQTKLYIPPTRPEVISRPHLINRLNEGLHRKLTLISAPAGSGKTTLAATWIQAEAENSYSNVAWLSLDESDNDLTLFWIYSITALQTVRSNLGQATLALLQSPGFNRPDLLPRIKNLLTGLINEIAAGSDRLILVFDDYHLVHTVAIHHSLNFFLDHLPPQLHLVIISREDPPLPLARLRVRQLITELRGQDLQFSLEEATQFLNQAMKLNLQPEAVSVLERRTEGWVAGLQMAALSLQHIAHPTDFIEAFAGDDRYVVDYLIAEVLERQPPHVLEFLQKTSILNRFTAALCEAVTGQTNVDEILTYLEETNLFLVALDNQRRWYRYHHLFGDLLYYRLKQTLPAQISKLHHLASRWYQEQSLIDDAIDHALAGEDYAYAADRIEQVGLEMIGQARLTRLQHWIDSLPAALIRERPYLPVFLAWISVLNMQADKAEAQLAQVEPGLQNLTGDPNLKGEIKCQVAMLRGYVSRLRRDLPASIAHIQRAIQILPNNNEFLHCVAHLNLGGNYWFLGKFAAVEAPLQQAVTFLDAAGTTYYPALVAAGYLTNTYLQQGQLGQAAKLCQNVEQKLAHCRRPPPAIAYVAIEQGALFYEQNDLEAATERLSQAVQLGENLDRIVNTGRALLGLAWIKQLHGQTDEAVALMERANANRPPSVVEFEHNQVRLWLVQENLGAAGQWARAYEEQRGTERPWQALNELTLAHVLLAEKKFERALEIVSYSEASARTAGIMGWVIRSLALKALCYQAMRNTDQALHSLQQAFVLAEPEGYRRTFIDLGQRMQQLLPQAAAQGIAPEYVAQLLAAFPDFQKDEPTQNLVEPLNDREQSILRLMAAGLSNREIGEELYLATNTVKWYCSQIYGKLGVGKRVEAVDRAHELGIL